MLLGNAKQAVLQRLQVIRRSLHCLQMGKTREIKKRIKAVANIRRITKTMQMIATAKFQSAMIRASASKPYAGGTCAMVGAGDSRSMSSVSMSSVRQR